MKCGEVKLSSKSPQSRLSSAKGAKTSQVMFGSLDKFLIVVYKFFYTGTLRLDVRPKGWIFKITVTGLCFLVIAGLFNLYYQRKRQKKIVKKFMDGVRGILLNDGRWLAYKEYGELKSNRVVLFFHSIGSSRLESFPNQNQIAKLLNFRMIHIDRPGYGRSDPSNERVVLSFWDDVKQLVDTLGIEKFSIIAVGAGAPFALGCALRNEGECNSVSQYKMSNLVEHSNNNNNNNNTIQQDHPRKNHLQSSYLSTSNSADVDRGHRKNTSIFDSIDHSSQCHCEKIEKKTPFDHKLDSRENNIGLSVLDNAKRNSYFVIKSDAHESLSSSNSSAPMIETLKNQQSSDSEERNELDIEFISNTRIVCLQLISPDLPYSELPMSEFTTHLKETWYLSKQFPTPLAKLLLKLSLFSPICKSNPETYTRLLLQDKSKYYTHEGDEFQTYSDSCIEPLREGLSCCGVEEVLREMRLIRSRDEYNRDMMRQISTIPVHIWHGKKNRLVPISLVRRFLSWTNPNVALHEIHNKGHYFYMNAAQFTEILSSISSMLS